MNFEHLVCYNHEIIPMKYAKPNQSAYFVCYNRDRYNRV